MAEASWALQQAIFAALAGDATLKGLIGDPARLYDHVPTDAAFPYVTLGEARAADGSTMAKDGQVHTVTVHAWSRERGRKEAKALMAAIHGVLHKGNLSVSGHVHAGTVFESAETLLERDGLTYHGVQRFRTVTMGV